MGNHGHDLSQQHRIGSIDDDKHETKIGDHIVPFAGIFDEKLVYFRAHFCRHHRFGKLLQVEPPGFRDRVRIRIEHFPST